MIAIRSLSDCSVTAASSRKRRPVLPAKNSVTLLISIAKGLNNKVTEFLAGKAGRRFLDEAAVTEQSDKDLIAIIPEFQRIRYAAPYRVPDEVFQAAAQTGFYISRTPVMMEGRIELLQYFKEQSICNDYHRYGNLGERA